MTKLKLLLPILLIILLSSFATADLETDLDLFLKGSDYVDYSGNSHTITNTGTTITDNKYVQDGNDYIYTDLNGYWKEDFSYNIMFKRGTLSSATYVMLSSGKSDATNPTPLMIDASGYLKTQIQVQGGTSSNVLLSFSPVNDLNWHMATVTYDYSEQDLILYLDGVKQEEQLNFAWSTGSNDQGHINVGAYGDYRGGLFWNGESYNVLTYSKALSQAEVTELYILDGNPAGSVPTITHTEISFSDVQLNPVSFTANNNYYEILTAQITPEQNYTGYIEVNVQMNSVNDLDVTCQLLVNGTVILERSRTNLGGTDGSLTLLSTNASFINQTEYNLKLQCSKSGANALTILDTRGVAHLFEDHIQVESHYLDYSSVTYSNGILDTHNYVANYTGSIIIDWASSIKNNEGTPQEILSQIYVDGSPICAEFKRDINAGKSSSIGGSCSFDGTEGVTYQIRTYLTGTNIDIEHQGHIKTLDNSEYVKIGTKSVTSSNTLLGTLVYDNSITNQTELYIKSTLSMHDSGETVNIFYEINGVNTNEIQKTASSNDEVSIRNYLTTIENEEITVKLYARSDTGTITINDGDFIIYPVDSLIRNITSFNITAYDEWTNVSLTNFNITYGDVTYSTTTGSLTVFVSATESADLTLSANNYFDLVVLDHNVSNNLVMYPYQTRTSFITKELFTNNTLTNLTYSINGSNNTEFHLSAGNYTVTASKQGYYDLLFNFSVPALFDDSVDLLGMYNSILNLTLLDVATNNTLTTANFTYVVDGTNYTETTTDGTFYIPMIQTTLLNTYLIAPNYAYSYNNITLDDPLENVPIYFYAENSIWITAKDLSTLSALTNFSVEIYNEFNVYNGTGTVVKIENVTSGEYTVKVSKPDYTVVYYIITVGEGSHQDLIAYLSSTTSPITFTLIDLGSSIIIPDVTCSIYYLIGANWTLVNSKNSDVTGRVQFNVDTANNYKFSFAKTDYTTKTFILEPVFETYTIKLSLDDTVIADIDKGDYYVDINPYLIYADTVNNISFDIVSGSGSLEYYNVTITSPVETVSASYSNTYGGSYNYEINVSNTEIIDTLNVTYGVKEVGQEYKTYTVLLTVQGDNIHEENTLYGFSEGLSQYGYFEKTIIATIIMLILLGIIATVSQMAGANTFVITGISLLVFSSLFVIIDFLPVWTSYIIGFAFILSLLSKLRGE